VTRQEFSLYLLGSYVDSVSKTNPVNRGLADTFVKGGLVAWDYMHNSREAHEELSETYQADDGLPVSPESKEYLRRKLEL